MGDCGADEAGLVMTTTESEAPAPRSAPDSPRRSATAWLRTGRSIAKKTAWKPIVAVYASVPLGIVAIVWLAGAGDLGSTPIWFLALVLSVTSVSNLVAFLWLRRNPGPGAPMQTRIAVCAFTTAGVVYAAGWGSMFVIGYAVGISEIVRTNGTATWRGALGWNAVAVAAGELAVHVHLAPSILPVGTAHEAAALGFCCLALVTRVLVLTSQTAEAAEATLRERSRQFESLVEHASDVIGVVDAAGNIGFVSPAVEVLLGYTPLELTGTPLDAVLDPEDAADVRRVLDELSVRPSTMDRRDVRFRHRNGHARRVVMTFTSRDASVIVNLHDVTVERELEDRLRFDAMHDPLTGTWNRAAFTEAMEMACAASARDNGTVALLFVDVDGFKQVNDTLGHSRGDELLVAVARSIQGCLRQGNALGRWGGDEFVVLLDRVGSPAEAVTVADRILVELEQLTTDPADMPRTTVSIGIATSTAGAHSAAALARLADDAMYSAKRSGRARWAVSPQVTDRSVGAISSIEVTRSGT